MKTLLREVPNGVIPDTYYNRLMDSKDSIPRLRTQLLDIFQPNLDIVVFLCLFILRISMFAPVNKMSLAN